MADATPRSYSEQFAENAATIEALRLYTVTKTTPPALPGISERARAFLKSRAGQEEVAVWLVAFQETVGLIQEFARLLRQEPASEDDYKAMVKASSRMLHALFTSLEELAPAA